MRGNFINNIKLLLCFALIIFLSPLSGQGKMRVNGYFAQAYAISDGNSIFGIPSKGTFDYRNAAIQFGFFPTETNKVIIQVNHNRIGQSPIMTLTESIELDWGILEQQFGDNWTFRAGRILLPLGIYNPIRDVSLLLPFYTIPFSPYGEASYTSETVDGFSATINTYIGETVSLDAEVYFGQWKWKEWYIFLNPLGGPPLRLIDEADVRSAFGAWVWLNDITEGLRIGAGGFIGKVEGGIQFQKGQLLGPQQLGLMDFAIDYTKDRYYIRGEINSYRLQRSKISSLGGYAQCGMKIIEPVELNLQYETTRAFNIQTIPNTPPKDLEYNRDIAVGIKFTPTHYLSIKLEGHINRGLAAEQPINPGEVEDGIQFDTRYAIFSVSAGF